ncbi:MAG: ATP synthase subunit I [Pyrinomonadaceae bacterium]
MSGNSEPVAVEQEKPVSLIHTRILWTMAIIVILGAILSFIFVGAPFGWGILIGGILSFLNYYWLKKSLKDVFSQAAEGGKPSFLTLNYFLRYLGLAVAIWILYEIRIVSVIAVLLGMSAFALAIFIEGLIIIFSSFSKREEF